MKKLIIHLGIIGAFFLIVFSSCQKEELNIISPNNGIEVIEMTATDTAINLDGEDSIEIGSEKFPCGLKSVKVNGCCVTVEVLPPPLGYTYEVNFGVLQDANTSTGDNTSQSNIKTHCYETSGTYTITLTYYTAKGIARCGASTTVTVNCPNLPSCCSIESYTVKPTSNPNVYNFYTRVKGTAGDRVIVTINANQFNVPINQTCQLEQVIMPFLHSAGSSSNINVKIRQANGSVCDEIDYVYN